MIENQLTIDNLNPIYDFALIILFFLVAKSFSQITLQAGAGGRLVILSADYSGSTIDYYNG